MERSHEAIKKCLTASGSSKKERGDTDAFWPKKGGMGGAGSKASGNGSKAEKIEQRTALEDNYFGEMKEIPKHGSSKQAFGLFWMRTRIAALFFLLICADKDKYSNDVQQSTMADKLAEMLSKTGKVSFNSPMDAD